MEKIGRGSDPAWLKREVNVLARAERKEEMKESLELVSKPYRSPKIRGIRGKKGADEEGVASYSARG